MFVTFSRFNGLTNFDEIWLLFIPKRFKGLVFPWDTPGIKKIVYHIHPVTPRGTSKPLIQKPYFSYVH